MPGPNGTGREPRGAVAAAVAGTVGGDAGGSGEAGAPPVGGGLLTAFSFDELDVGDVVHFVLEQGASTGQCRPGVVVRIWEPRSDSGIVQIVVVQDGTNDDPYAGTLVRWVSSVERGVVEGPLVPRTWHPRAECRTEGG